MAGVLSKLKRRYAATTSKQNSNSKPTYPISNPFSGEDSIVPEARSSPGRVSDDTALTVPSSKSPNTLDDQPAYTDEQRRSIRLPSESRDPCAAQAGAAAAMTGVTATYHGQRSLHSQPSKAAKGSVPIEHSGDETLKTRKGRLTVRKFRKNCGKATRNVGKAISSLFPELHSTSTQGYLSRGTQTVSTEPEPPTVGTRIESKKQESSIHDETINMPQDGASASGNMQSSKPKNGTSDTDQDNEALNTTEDNCFVPKTPANDPPVQAKLHTNNDNIKKLKNIVIGMLKEHNSNKSAINTPSEANLGDEGIDALKEGSEDRATIPSKDANLASNIEIPADDRPIQAKRETVPEEGIVEDEILKTSTAFTADERFNAQKEGFRNDALSAQHGFLLFQAKAHHASTRNTSVDGSKSSSVEDRTVMVSEEHPQYGTADTSNEIETERFANETKGVKIAIEDLERLALQARVQFDDNFLENNDLHVKYIRTSGGNNNRVHFMEYGDGVRVCIRVPDCGEPGKWFANDARSLSSSVMTMGYVSRNMPNIPIPKILDFDVTLDNVTNAPYTIKTYMEGHNVEELWFNRSLPVPRETRRQNILGSLATAMAQLRTHSFSWMGTLDFSQGLDSPISGPIFDRGFGEHRSENFDASDGTYTRKWTESLQAGMKERIEAWSEANAEYAYRIDIDFQNLLADEEGNITGILDWDRVDTVPAFLGWACQPHWLGEDWSGEYVWPDIFDSHTMSPSQLNSYRASYAEYMWQAADGDEDVQYTRASSMMYAIYTQFGGRYHYDVFFEILDQIVPRLGRVAYLERVARYGFAPGEESFLREAISQLYKGSLGLLRA